MDVENVVFVVDLLKIASRTTTNEKAITADQVKEVVGGEMTDLVDQEIVSKRCAVRDEQLLEALIINLTGCFYFLLLSTICLKGISSRRTGALVVCAYFFSLCCLLIYISFLFNALKPIKS